MIVAHISLEIDFFSDGYTMLRYYLFFFLALSWFLGYRYKLKRKKAADNSNSIKTKILEGRFSSADIPLISYTIQQGRAELGQNNFSTLIQKLMPGTQLGTDDLPVKIVTHFSLAENKTVLVIEAAHEDPDMMVTGDRQKFLLHSMLYIEFSYDAEAGRYLFRSPYFKDNPEKSLLRKTAYQLENHLLKA